MMGAAGKDSKQQESDAAAYREGLTALVAREAQHRQLAAIRLELERLRLLLERVSKRERLKRESMPPCSTSWTCTLHASAITRSCSRVMSVSSRTFAVQDLCSSNVANTVNAAPVVTALLATTAYTACTVKCSFFSTACTCAVARTTVDLQQAQMADPAAALQYQRQLDGQGAASIQHEPSPAPEANSSLDPAYSLPQSHARESAERHAQLADDTDEPGISAAHSKPASLGWGRLKKVKLAAKAEGSPDIGSKRRRDTDTGV